MNTRSLFYILVDLDLDLGRLKAVADNYHIVPYHGKEYQVYSMLRPLRAIMHCKTRSEDFIGFLDVLDCMRTTSIAAMPSFSKSYHIPGSEIDRHSHDGMTFDQSLGTSPVPATKKKDMLRKVLIGTGFQRSGHHDNPRYRAQDNQGSQCHPRQ